MPNMTFPITHIKSQSQGLKTLNSTLFRLNPYEQFFPILTARALLHKIHILVLVLVLVPIVPGWLKNTAPFLTTANQCKNLLCKICSCFMVRSPKYDKVLFLLFFSIIFIIFIIRVFTVPQITR